MFAVSEQHFIGAHRHHSNLGSLSAVTMPDGEFQLLKPFQI